VTTITKVPKNSCTALGQKRTLTRVPATSAILPKVDIRCGELQVRFVPKADMRQLL